MTFSSHLSNVEPVERTKKMFINYHLSLNIPEAANIYYMKLTLGPL